MTFEPLLHLHRQEGLSLYKEKAQQPQSHNLPLTFVSMTALTLSAKAGFTLKPEKIYLSIAILPLPAKAQNSSLKL